MNIEEFRKQLETESLEEIPLRVTYYARVGADGENPIRSLQVQEEVLKNAIQARKNWTFVAGYADVGNGMKTEGRNGFLNLMQDSGKDMFDLVLTTDFGRLTRDRIEEARCIEKLHDNGVVVSDIACRFHSLNLIYSITKDSSVKKRLDNYKNVGEQERKQARQKRKEDRSL